MAENPYAPPASRVADAQPDATEFPDATRLRRFSNYLIDVICFYVMAALVGVVLALLDAGDWVAEMGRLEEFVFGIGIFIVYYWGSESIAGRTIGKLVTGTRAIREDGAAPGVKLALYRTLARLIPFEPFSIFTGEPRMWHDTLPGTRVVRIRQ